MKINTAYSARTSWRYPLFKRRNKRPTPLTNQHPERDILGINNPKRNKNLIPGNIKHNESVRYGRKEFVFGTSMVKGEGYFEALDKALDSYSGNDRIVWVGDFNAGEKQTCIETFLYQHDFKNLIKESTCFKNSSKSTIVDLFLTNTSTYFQTQKQFSHVSQIFTN